MDRQTIARLLVVDDEPNVLYSLEKSLQSDWLQVVTAATAREGINLVRDQRPDAVILDVRLPDMSGLDAFDEIRQIDPRLPVIILTAYGTTETAIEAMKRGAFEYLLKPVDFRQLRSLVGRAVELSHLRHVPAVIAENDPADDESVDRIIGETPAMREVYKAIGRVTPLDVPVLIQGESGTGKELVARAIYQHSRRAQKPFLAINCAAIPEGILESELFGHEKGAYTGADRRRIGKFEQADQGTLFLDEIGDMTLGTQPKLLRVLQEQKFERVGGDEVVRTDVRVLAATNQNLDERSAAGSFRDDLLYRLRVFTISIPPLRERREDLPLLINHFLKLLSRRLGKRVDAVTPDAIRLLEAYPWPGNIRELQSAIRHAYVQSAGAVITSECLPEHLRGEPPAPRLVNAERDPQLVELTELVSSLLRAGEPDVYDKVNAVVDRVVLEAALRHVKGSQAQASKLLGISRTTLRSKLLELGLMIEKKLLPESTRSTEISN
ncbi:MAG TPA: sigma-54 dependent transcriptional regulator [Planctomycetaceae bacterium]|jgi:two-component system nitrogen regulation response regulator GlnG|nr:sigma-54 dependent transcriptional regulator [Planctomycetaceae bacterium]